jgi:hypothetical protein
MAKQLTDKLGKGITPQAFIDGMTQNQDKFLDWHRKFEWKNDDDKQFFEEISVNRDDLRCLILMADWCGDVVRNVPVLFHALETAQIPVEVLIMEQNLDVMDQFLTMGGRSIPIAIFTDTAGFILGQWGPRPSYVQEPMVRFKQENPDKEAPDYQENLSAARKEIMARYGEGTDYQQLIIRELRDLISSF